MQDPKINNPVEGQSDMPDSPTNVTFEHATDPNIPAANPIATPGDNPVGGPLSDQQMASIAQSAKNSAT